MAQHSIPKASISDMGTPFLLTLRDDSQLWGVDSEDERAPCVLIHGFADASLVWCDFARRVRQQFRTLAVDLRGHGHSGWDLAGNYDAELLASDISQVLQLLAIKDAFLLGHSLGGEIAMRVAAAVPERIRFLGIVDMGPECNGEGRRRIREDVCDMPWSYPNVEAYAQWLVAHRPLANVELLRGLAAHNLVEGPNGQMSLRLDPALRAVAAQETASPTRGAAVEAELWRALHRVKCPTVVVRGLGSSVFPRAVGEKMVASYLASGEFVEVSGAGHSVMVDNPEGFYAAISAFLTKVA
jgi:pimeloyl-ACP methyl ester carboxylesterase